MTFIRFFYHPQAQREKESSALSRSRWRCDTAQSWTDRPKPCRQPVSASVSYFLLPGFLVEMSVSQNSLSTLLFIIGLFLLTTKGTCATQFWLSLSLLEYRQYPLWGLRTICNSWSVYSLLCSPITMCTIVEANRPTENEGALRSVWLRRWNKGIVMGHHRYLISQFNRLCIP